MQLLIVRCVPGPRKYNCCGAEVSDSRAAHPVFYFFPLVKVKFGEAADQDSQELFGLICQFIHDFKRAHTEMIWGTGRILVPGDTAAVLMKQTELILRSLSELGKIKG